MHKSGRWKKHGDVSAVSSLLAVFVVIILILSGLGVFLSYSANSRAEAAKTVGLGSAVKVDYVGMFADNGKVFDTNMESVQNDNGTYPKAPLYSWKTSFSTLDFTVGKYTMLKEFELATLGMKIGETKEITIKAANAYGALNESLLYKIDLEDTFNATETMSYAEATAYYGVVLSAGLTIKDPLYGWDVLVLSYDATSSRVTVVNMPGAGETTWKVCGSDTDDSFGWDAIATLEDGVITLRHQITQADVDVKKGYDETGTAFVIYSVDEENGEFVINKNSQTAGEDLVFRITIRAIN